MIMQAWVGEEVKLSLSCRANDMAAEEECRTCSNSLAQFWHSRNEGEARNRRRAWHIFTSRVESEVLQQ